jgi:hypothetical protein
MTASIDRVSNTFPNYARDRIIHRNRGSENTSSYTNLALFAD